MEWKSVVEFVFSRVTSNLATYNKKLLSSVYFLFLFRSQSFKEDDGTWKGNDDGKVVNNQPQRVMDDRNGMMAQAGYIGRYYFINIKVKKY